MMNKESNYKPISSYLIPVGDLLHKQWSSDSLIIDYISLEWYTIDHCKVVITAISDTEIVVQLPSFEYRTINRICDYCGSNIDYVIVSTKQEMIHFMLHLDQIDKKEQEQYDFIYEIHSDRNIDILPAIRASILLSQQLQYICENCIQSTQESNHVDQHSKSSNPLIFTHKKRHETR